MDLSLTPAAKYNIKNLLICVSLGNLCFVRRWSDLEQLKERSMDYYRTAPVDPTLLLATVISALLLGLAFWVAWRWVERTRTRARLILARSTFFLLLIYSIETLRRYWQSEGVNDPRASLAIFAIESILGLGLILVWFEILWILRAMRSMVLLLTLLLPSLLIDFGWAWINRERAQAYQPLPSAPVLSHSATPRRLLWLLFDEFDQRVAFDQRPSSLELPELDRLRAESVVGNQTTETAEWTTFALPSLLSGRDFGKAHATDSHTLFVYPEGSNERLNWRDQPNVFKQARGLGFNAAMAGWHHPYCRVIGDQLVRCLEAPGSTIDLLRETDTARKGLLKSIPYMFELLLYSMGDLFRSRAVSQANDSRDAYVQAQQLPQYFRVRDAAYSAAADRQIDFLFVHFPPPHPFAIYDRQRRDFVLSKSTSYFDSLALVDRIVGELRRTLEQAGLWETTSILITSDHAYRAWLWRGRRNWTPEMERLTSGPRSETVPFIVKLAGRNQGMVYDKPFSNIVASELSLALLSGQVSTAADARAWLDEHAALSAKTPRP